MVQFKKLNNIIGWVAFAISLAVYMLTLEPTASFWDCGEFLSAADKQQVVHPPGAPMFLLLGKFFSLFALGNQANVAYWTNVLSAFTSALTVLFIFWTITHLAKKIYTAGKQELTSEKTYAIMAAGFVGALTCTFLDTFWFSAVESEVYAASCFFSAIAFWSILKWENTMDTDPKNADKWLVMIAFLVGVSVGIHLLNLLVIPAVVFVYFFKKYHIDTKRFIIAIIVALSAIIVVQNVIIPGYPWLILQIEILFVNVFHMPFNTGYFGFLIIMAALFTFLLMYTKRKGKTIWNMVTLCALYISIGYGSYAMLVIRSLADVPLDHQNVEDPNNLLSYLNREQYGNWPLLYGQNFDAKPIDVVKGRKLYVRNEKTGRYDATGNKLDYKWDPKSCTLFPRMWNMEENKKQGYRNWTGLRPDEKVKFKHNLEFMFKYQLGFMYWRYFMWNFVGRQNDKQSTEWDPINGGISSGVSFIDQLWEGDRNDLPESEKNNKGHNTFFFLPLILGILGMYWQYKRDSKDFFVILSLFLLTGLLIVVYLNTPPYQPRERDYAFVGSFQYFCVWIGLGVLGLIEFLSKRMKMQTATGLAFGICLLASPILMATQNWDDHDRSKRTIALSCAIDYLESCDKDAVLFTNGDNDTYPLWYAQAVEGIRTDVRVINLSLLNTDWYIDVMKRQAYDSKPINMSLRHEVYAGEKMNQCEVIPTPGLSRFGIADTGFSSLKAVMDFVGSDDCPKLNNGAGRSNDGGAFFPTNKFYIKVNKQEMIANKVIELKDTSLIEDIIYMDFSDHKSFNKSEIAVLDYIANNFGKRPVCFTTTSGASDFKALQRYFQVDGLCYKLVPGLKQSPNSEMGYVNTTKSLNLIKNKFKFGGTDIEGVYIDETSMRQCVTLRHYVFITVANALSFENRKKEAEDLLDLAMKVLPEKNVPLERSGVSLAEAYYRAGNKTKGLLYINKTKAYYTAMLNHLEKLSSSPGIENDKGQYRYFIQQIDTLAAHNN